MKIINSLQLFLLLVCVLISGQTFAQNGWTTCGSVAGKLSGTTNNIYMSDTTPVPVYVVAPSPTNKVPTREFVLILKDSLASDTLGNAIIASNWDGRFSPAALGLSVGDSFEIVSFAYDIVQIKKAVQGILKNSVPFLGSCCNLVQNATSINVCGAMIAAGINDSSDVNNINDLLIFLGAFSGGGSTSLRGLNAVLVGINAQIGTLNNVGCTNGVSQVCYAADSLANTHDHYVITTMTSVFDIQDVTSLQIAVSPNPFMDQIATGIKTSTGGEHVIRVLDATGRVVHQEVQVLSVGEQTIWMNLSRLSAGLYYLQVTDNGHIATQKIIKR